MSADADKEPRLIYTTASDPAEAARLCDALVEENLVACANILGPMASVYRWEGEIQRAQEIAVILKTSADRVARVSARLAELHSYDCPCVVALPIVGGHQPFIDWIVDEAEA